MPSTNGPWSLQAVEEFLCGPPIPLRLAGVREDGYPLLVSLWYRYHDGALQCVTHRNSYLLQVLQRAPRVGFEVAPNAPPYHGVRGRGDVVVSELGDAPVLEALLDRYLGGRDTRVARWLLSRKADEMLLTLQPRHFSSWDFRERMADVPAPS